jgi:hypothetical protein
MRVRISFDTLGPIDRPFVQIRLSLPDGAHFVLGFPPPTMAEEDQRGEEVFMGEEAHKPGDEVPVTSSAPLRLLGEQESIFQQVLTLFEKERLPYAVAGAYALQQHTGICRFTKDLDVFLTPQDMAPALKHLREFEYEICDPIWLAKVHRDDYFVDLITGRP